MNLFYLIYVILNKATRPYPTILNKIVFIQFIFCSILTVVDVMKKPNIAKVNKKIPNIDFPVIIKPTNFIT